MGAGADSAGLPLVAWSRFRNGASMRMKILRPAAAVLVFLGLSAAPAPAAAAPDRDQARTEAGMGAALLDQLTAWLTNLWAGSGPAAPDGPAGIAQRLASHPDPDGEPAAESPAGQAASSDDDPTAEPQLGPAPDPNG